LITKKSFIEFLTEQFFEQLGMHQTGFASQKNTSDDFAIGYRVENEKIVLADNVDMMQKSGAGFLYSTGHVASGFTI
jgi:CubicO group peptidase (beta-lactamase class C family)